MPSLLNLKYSLRSLKNNKFSLFINIFGFAVSLAFVIMIGLYVQKEYSVDNYHKDKERIFMLSIDNGDLTFPAGFMPALLSNYPQIEKGTIAFSESLVVELPNGDKSKVSSMVTEPEFFDIFSFNFKEGSAATALASMKDIVLSESFARAHFGDRPVVGETVKIDSVTFNVSAVVEDFKNSHIGETPVIISADYIKSINFILRDYTSWPWAFYLKGTPNSDLKSLEEDITEFGAKTIPRYHDFLGDAKLKLIPVEEIYLTDVPSNNLAVLKYMRTSDSTFITAMLMTAVLILFFAVINYLNLSVAQSGFRAKSTAIQRLLGSSKRALFWGFIVESVAILAVSGILAMLIARLAMPWFGQLMSLRLSFGNDFTTLNGVMIVAIVLFTGALAGWVPAMIISGFKPIEVTRGSFRYKSKNLYSKLLIIFQYTITIVLLGCTAIIVQQMTYMQRGDLGFDQNNLIVCSYSKPMPNDATPFVNALKEIPGVVGVSQCAGYPMINSGNNRTFWDNDGVKHSHNVYFADTAFMSVFGIKAITPDNHNTNGRWINETAAKELGVEKGDVEYNRAGSYVIPIRGIVKDFHYTDFTNSIGAVEIMPLMDGMTPWNIAIKVRPENRREVFAQVREVYNRIAGSDMFDGQFMDEQIAFYYKSQQRLSNMFGILSFIAIIISSMGMLAMSIYFTRQRARDMAVRKVFGATPQGVLRLLMGGFMKLVIVAFVIAVPVIYLIMREWLSSYVYRIDITPVPFVIAGGIVLVIAVLTVIGYSLKVAYSNPVDSLKTE